MYFLERNERRRIQITSRTIEPGSPQQDDPEHLYQMISLATLNPSESWPMLHHPLCIIYITFHIFESIQYHQSSGLALVLQGESSILQRRKVSPVHFRFSKSDKASYLPSHILQEMLLICWRQICRRSSPAHLETAEPLVSPMNLNLFLAVRFNRRQGQVRITSECFQVRTRV